MIPEKVLYTDGHEVTVTDSFFKVRKSLYQLKGITKHGIFIIRPERITPILVLTLGVLMIALGFFHLVPRATIPDFTIQAKVMSGNAAALGLGIVFFALGAFWLAFMKDRYAVRIATAEGEKNVVVSRKREYINQILDALNHAFMDLVSPERQTRRGR